jgi:Mlc titration factor MtfA (ptsG expression regulator)
VCWTGNHRRDSSHCGRPSLPLAPSQGNRLIRIYPGNQFPISSAKSLSGESWQEGVVLLAWDAVRHGTADPFDGDNVVLHEFAHQLDQEDGEADGVPRLARGMSAEEQASAYTSWARMLATEYEEFRRNIGEGAETVMDSYGALDRAEFFAVATECFFEKPKQLRKKHPQLYAELNRFYQQDPAEWIPEDLDAETALEEPVTPPAAPAG